MPKKKIILISFILAAGILIIPLAESGYFFIKGLRALRQGFEGKSVKYLEKSVKINPHFPEAYMLLALAYAEWGSSSKHYIEHDEEGLIKLKSETLGRAEDVLKTALARFPFHKDRIQYMLARIYDGDARNSGYIWDKDKAIQGYKQLTSDYPHSRYVQEARERIEVLTR
jgi:tetratricopeptide (TPR) repeat protein